MFHASNPIGAVQSTNTRGRAPLSLTQRPII
jgi:hypothetical protein